MYDHLKEQLHQVFSGESELIVSAPGRTEIGGNHTDHQHGKVLAAAIDLKSVAAVKRSKVPKIRVLSAGYPLIEINLTDLNVKVEESGTSAGMIRGIASGFRDRGFSLVGFDACVQSDVVVGSGLSSSASFEILIAMIINELAKANLPAVELARIGQAAENRYFGKPCGLLDQATCSVGGLVAMDFKDPASPLVEKLNFDFAAHGFDLCVIATGADHANLTDAYASIPYELKKLCHVLGAEVLRDVPEGVFYRQIPLLRQKVGDRAVLRAIHIYEENKRVDREVAALKVGNMDGFLHEVRESGLSSWRLLQNVIPEGRNFHQEMAFGLALAEKKLNGSGACRVHGGGFAGMIQAYVPIGMTAEFREEMETVLGKGTVRILKIQPFGGLVEEIIN